MDAYTFSYYTVVRVPRLVRRPWWAIFGRDSIEFDQRLERKVVSGLSERHATVLSRVDAGVLAEILSGAQRLQLEVGGPTTSYIATCSEPKP